MNGRVDDDGRALIPIAIRSGPTDVWTTFEAWIDTGFTGELVISKKSAQSLGLRRSGTLNAQLGDGSFVSLEMFHCLLEWCGQILAVQVVTNDGPIALLGVGLLSNGKLVVDYPAKTVSFE